MNEITADDLYEGLLSYGFFSEKLPPVFTAIPFFNYCKSMPRNFGKIKNEYVSFRTMRNISVPRQMGIPAPMQYQQLCATLRDYWIDIKQHFYVQTKGQKYRVSRIHIRKEKGTKRLFAMNYKNYYTDGNPEFDLLIHDKGVSRLLVKADISTCFPSIYTHAIPWALVGKAQAKATQKDRKIWYNKIDKACQAVKYGETHGLLIGPHASNLISELILTVIDKKLYDYDYRFVRNIDDYDCYVDSYEKAECFLCDLENALREFDLPLNHKKTQIVKLPISIEKNWKHKLSCMPEENSFGQIEYPQVNSFIDMALSLATEIGDFAIINYAIKKLANKSLTDNSKKLASKRFIHMAVLYPYLLHLMEEYVFIPYGVSTDEIKTLSDAIYEKAKKTNDYESMCYSVYYALKYGFNLNELDIDYILKQKDCVLLVLAWLYYLKVNHWNRRATEVKLFNAEARNLMSVEMGRYWLFCYEVLTAGNLHEEWKNLKEASVSFIEPAFLNEIGYPFGI